MTAPIISDTEKIEIYEDALQGIAINAHFFALDNHTMHPSHLQLLIDLKVAAKCALENAGVKPEVND